MKDVCSHWDHLSFPPEQLNFLWHIAVTWNTSEKKNMELHRVTEHCWLPFLLVTAILITWKVVAEKQTTKQKRGKEKKKIKKTRTTHILCIWKSWWQHYYEEVLKVVRLTLHILFSLQSLNISRQVFWMVSWWFLFREFQPLFFYWSNSLFSSSNSFPAVFIPSPWGQNHTWMPRIFLFFFTLCFLFFLSQSLI